MDVRVALIVFSLLVATWVCDARHVASPALSGVENVDVCTMCEEYTTLALDYLSENRTETEVMETLHKACLQMHGLKEQCMTLVDYYAPLFFLEVSSVQPEEFCNKFGLCRNARMSSYSKKQNACDLCHHAIDEVLDKLKDPETKMEIIELLLKACNSVENYSKKCKSMVFEYGPIILVDAEKFIEKVDICTTLHACNNEMKVDDKQVIEGEIEMVTSS